MPAPVPAPVVSPSTPITAEEAAEWLRSLAYRKTGSVPVGTVVQHVLRICQEGDWPVQRAALEAILRRRSSAESEALRIRARPARSALGLYKVSGSTRDRTYSVLLTSLQPLAASCECADFVRSSLGLCKHVWTVLEPAASRKIEKLPAPRAVLSWDSVRPLTGKGDWLERVRWSVTEELSAPERRLLQRWFNSALDGAVPLVTAFAEDLPKRLALVRDLRRFVAGAGKAGRLVEPALRTLLAAEEARLEQRVASEPLARDLKKLTKGLHRQLYPYQAEGVRRALANGRLLLGDDMGLGKTAQAIATCHALWTAQAVRRGLIVVPAALKSQWLREWQEFTDTPAAVVDGSSEERAAIYRKQKEGFLIVNYEQVLRDLLLMHGWKPDIVVLDEAQRIKNWQTKTSATVKRLDPPYRLVLTGTPMENRLDELASILSWVDDTALEPKWRLAPWHSVATDGRREARGARNLATLRDRLADSFLRRRRDEVLAQLPERSDTRVPVEMTPQQEEAHEELRQPISQLVARAGKRPLTQAEFLKLMQLLTTQRMICNGLALQDFDEVAPRLRRARPTDKVIESLFTPKLAELRELLEQLVVTQGLKVVVFSQWRRMLTLAEWVTADVLAGAGKRAVFFTGQESQKRRTQNIVDIHDDPTAAVLFATDAGGVGLNLQRAASACINLELPWNPAVLEQRIGRIHRNGQKRPVEIYNLVSETGIEARIAGLVADKRALFTGLFDGTSNEVTFEGSGSFLSRVEKIVAPVPAVEEVIDLERETEEVEGEASLPEEPAAEEAGDGGLLIAADVVPAVAEALPIAALEAASPVAAPEVVAASAVAPETVASEQPPAAPRLDVQSIRQLVSQVRIQPRADGGITIDAPREAAATLGALLGELARMLSSPQG